MKRRAKVYYQSKLCGYLVQDDDGFLFFYTDEWLMDKEAKPISLTMPLTKKEYRSPYLFAFFDGLIPEGWLLDLALKKFNLDIRDRMGILLKTGKDVIGAVGVEEIKDE